MLFCTRTKGIQADVPWIAETIWDAQRVWWRRRNSKFNFHQPKRWSSCWCWTEKFRSQSLSFLRNRAEMTKVLLVFWVNSRRNIGGLIKSCVFTFLLTCLKSTLWSHNRFRKAKANLNSDTSGTIYQCGKQDHAFRNSGFTTWGISTFLTRFDWLSEVKKTRGFDLIHLLWIALNAWKL